MCRGYQSALQLIRKGMKRSEPPGTWDDPTMVPDESLPSVGLSTCVHILLVRKSVLESRELEHIALKTHILLEKPFSA